MTMPLLSFRPILTSVRGRLLMFNLLVVAVTLMVSGVAITGFIHAGNLQALTQARTLSEMTGGMNLGRDTTNVSIAAMRLSQVVGPLEYQSESARLKQTQLMLQSSLRQLAQSPLASSEPALIERIAQRSNALGGDVTRLLEFGYQRHLQRNQLLSELYQCQMYLQWIDSIAARENQLQSTAALRRQIDGLLNIAIKIPNPYAVLTQLGQVMNDWPATYTDYPLSDKISRFLQNQGHLIPLARQLSVSDLAISYDVYHIKALVGMLNGDISLYVQKVANESALHIRQTHQELASIIFLIGLFALLSLVITGFAGWYIYRNIGSNLTVIADAMSQLARGKRQVSVPGLQRRDELGDLARAFNVFAGNTASLERTSHLLKEKSTQLENTFLAMRDGFALFDRDGHLVVWNPQYPLLLGLEATALFRGRHYHELLDELRRLQVRVSDNADWQDMATQLHNEQPHAWEIYLPDGRTMELRFSPLAERGLVNMVLDRTERKVLEQALVHSQKMKAVGQLTGGLAHDFNNLLAVIIGSLELCGTDSGDDNERIARARKAAERGAVLTHRLLAFSRKQALFPQAVHLTELVKNLYELLCHLLPANLVLTLESRAPVWPAWIDVNQLENAIMNLVVNSRDAMEGRSGEILIRTYNQHVVRTGGKRQDMVALEVIDRGCGMSDEIKSQVYEPFFTTKSIGSGSGLGLSMVYGFIRQSGGRVQIESAPGAGTCVRLQLPRAPMPVSPPSLQRQPLPDRPADDSLLVMVLEDQEDVLDTLCEQLHQLGYMTLATTSSTEALAILRQTPDIDLLVSDLMLPGDYNGAEVIQLARKEYPALGTLLISGQDLHQNGIGPLMDIPLLRKPFTRRQLAQMLRLARNTGNKAR
ncbi:ATP-binding protein [Sodalis sp. RH15]|uniref:ATP-binding protein n=1 Tax=Sodalis sp. RH15 TaxID=3394330 RepID=UPI0039B46CC8